MCELCAGPWLGSYLPARESLVGGGSIRPARTRPEPAILTHPPGTSFAEPCKRLCTALDMILRLQAPGPPPATWRMRMQRACCPLATPAAAAHLQPGAAVLGRQTPPIDMVDPLHAAYTHQEDESRDPSPSPLQHRPGCRGHDVPWQWALPPHLWHA